MSEKEMQGVAAAIAQAAQAMSTALLPAWKQVNVAIQNVYDALHAHYVAEGAIYGDTREGMMRWLRERGEIARHEAAAERLRQRQWMIADFQRQVRERRGNVST